MYKEIEFEDDVVIVYEDGNEIYRGMEDYEPMKDEPWKWDDEQQCYTLTGECFEYRKVCLDC